MGGQTTHFCRLSAANTSLHRLFSTPNSTFYPHTRESAPRNVAAGVTTCSITLQMSAGVKAQQKEVSLSPVANPWQQRNKWNNWRNATSQEKKMELDRNRGKMRMNGLACA